MNLTAYFGIPILSVVQRLSTIFPCLKIQDFCPKPNFGYLQAEAVLPEDPTKDSKYNESIIDSVRAQKDEVRFNRELNF